MQVYIVLYVGHLTLTQLRDNCVSNCNLKTQLDFSGLLL